MLFVLSSMIPDKLVSFCFKKVSKSPYFSVTSDDTLFPEFKYECPPGNDVVTIDGT